MGFGKRSAQLCDALERMRRDDKLMGIGAAVVGNSGGFSAPDQFCAAATDALPATKHGLGDLPVGGGIPSFHWMNRDTIGKFDAGTFDGLKEWRRLARENLCVVRNIEAERAEMFTEARELLDRSQAKNGSAHAERFSWCQKASVMVGEKFPETM